MKLYVKVQKWITRHPITNRLATDIRYRTTATAFVSLIINISFAVYNCVLGVYTTSSWFVTMSFYYLLLGFMRFQAVMSSIKIQKLNEGERVMNEYKLMRTIGIVLLFLPLALSGTVVLTIIQNHVKSYSTIIMITIATYTFYKVIFAIINYIRIKKQHSPLLIAIRNINTADAAMSILPMQTSMIASFNTNSTMNLNLMTIFTGTGICFIFITLGVTMIIKARRNIKWQNQNS